MSTSVKGSGNSQSEFASRPASCADYPVTTLCPNLNCTMHFKCHYASITCEKSQLWTMCRPDSLNIIWNLCVKPAIVSSTKVARHHWVTSFSDKIVYHNKSLQLLQLFWSPVLRVAIAQVLLWELKWLKKKNRIPQRQEKWKEDSQAYSWTFPFSFYPAGKSLKSVSKLVKSSWAGRGKQDISVHVSV